jgi:hypothetical protein
MSKNKLSHRESAHIFSDMLIASGIKKADVWDKKREETQINIENGYIIISPKTDDTEQVRIFADEISRIQPVAEDFNSRFTVIKTKEEMVVNNRVLVQRARR